MALKLDASLLLVTVFTSPSASLTPVVGLPVVAPFRAVVDLAAEDSDSLLAVTTLDTVDSSLSSSVRLLEVRPGSSMPFGHELQPVLPGFSLLFQQFWLLASPEFGCSPWILVTAACVSVDGHPSPHRNCCGGVGRLVLARTLSCSRVFCLWSPWHEPIQALSALFRENRLHCA